MIDRTCTLRLLGGLTIGTLCVLTLTACKTNVAGEQAVASGSGVAAESAALNRSSGSGTLPTPGSAAVASIPASSAPPASVTSSAGVTTVPATPASASTTSSSPSKSGGSGSGNGNGSGAGNSGSGGSGSSSSLPRFVSASAGCVLNNDDGTYHLIVSWELKNATGMALSVDNPGLVGSYGSYSWHGAEDLSTLGCYTDDRTRVIDLYSIGGPGQRAKKSFHIHENHNRIKPPPFAGNTQTSGTPTYLPTPTAGQTSPTTFAATTAAATPTVAETTTS